MQDRDLAELYGVPTKQLNLAVKRNLKRFPSDFMFQLTEKELKILRFQNETSSWGGSRYLPYVFTEHGVAMLSSVLSSDKAIEVNIGIMRVFTMVRQVAMNYKELQDRIAKLEKQYKKDYRKIYEVLQAMIADPPEEKPMVKIGYKVGNSSTPQNKKASSKK